MLPLPEVQELLSKATDKIEVSVSATEGKLSGVREEMDSLKVDLPGHLCPEHREYEEQIRLGRDIYTQVVHSTLPPNSRTTHDAPSVINDLDEDGDTVHQSDGEEERPHDSNTTLSESHDLEAKEPKVIKDGASTFTIVMPLHPRHLQLDAVDAQQRYHLEKGDNPPANPKQGRRIVLSFPRGDPENPYNWPTRKKIFILFIGIVSTVNSTLGSSLPSGAIEYISEYWNITSQAQLVLPISLFLIGYVFGPLVFAPLMVSWRWTFWVGLIVAGLSLAFLFFMPETYGPTILKKRAKRMRKETGNPNIFAPIELEKKGVKQMLTITLTRPLRMIFFEAIVLSSCIYLSIAYAIFYLYFEAYPLIFEGIYGFNTGTAGLPFLAIGVGAFLSTGIFMYWDLLLVRAKKANAPWTKVEEYRRLPLACIGGPLYVVSLFWLGWTANASVHWMVPIVSGIPFGVGFMLIFMALLNYITDAYEIFAASGMAATSACRSIFGAVLPLAARPMYTSLGIAWASSLLGLVSLAMCLIPFAFIKYGDRLRANSQFCKELRENKARYEAEQVQEEGIASSQEHDSTSIRTEKHGPKEEV
ncbi:MAG: hypothetical protein Q9170_005882 [Blastenia crenularia]